MKYYWELLYIYYTSLWYAEGTFWMEGGQSASEVLATVKELSPRGGCE